MQQLVVEAAHADWRYLSCPGYEVVSRCDAVDTKWFVAGFFRSLELQDELLPAHFLPTQTVPLTAILYDRKPDPTQSGKNLVPTPMEVSPATGPSWGTLQNISTLSGHVLAQDRDTVAFATNLWGSWRKVNPDSTPIFADGGLLGSRLLRRGPVPPLWFIAGLTQPYGLARVIPERSALIIPGAVWVSPGQAQADLEAANNRALSTARQSVRSAPEDVVSLQPFVTTGHSQLLLLPLQEIFRERRADEGAPSRLWMAEAALFVRWGFFADQNNPLHRLNFLRFVARADSEPLTEAIFQECFGFGYGEMESRLAEYLTAANGNLIHTAYRVIPFWPPPLPTVINRPATDAEVARIVGDWERMTGLKLRARRPDLSRLYLHHAGDTLRRAYAAGSRDPTLLAVLGLYDHDAGDDASARLMLEAAMKAAAVRPAAFLLLARLRLAAAQSHPGGPEGKLSAEQVADVTAPILALKDLTAWSLASYQLFAEVQAQSALRPAPADIAILALGVGLFPRSASLIKSAALVCAQWNYPQRASEFIGAGMKFADDHTLAEFDALLTSLQKNRPPR